MASGGEPRIRTLFDLDEQEVSQMMQNLIDEQNAEPLLFDVTQNHRWDPRRSAVEMARDLNTQSTDQDGSEMEEDSQRLQNIDWCLCGKCKLMPTVIESFCCREMEEVVSKIQEGHNCISEHDYHQNTKDREFLKRIALITNSLGPYRLQGVENMPERAFRKLAYRDYTCWIHGFLGPKNRKPIPSCVVNSIRSSFPEADNIYVGFHYPEDDGPAFEMILD
ncbi:P2X purinoceptor 7 [Bombina bombina]|uniref:P2X purinoceptor 7 n=1 Tax=Bombina bombina TaxID=8345 RepID=UPI00235AF15D|nr:P2X purinoceptor 7 [Bombina bombina]